MIRLFWEDKELKRVRCPRPYNPPVPLTACIKCPGHNGIQIPVDKAPYVICGYGNKYSDIECVS